MVIRARWHVTDVGAPRTPADEYVSSKVWFTLHGVDFPGAGWSDDPLPTLSTAVIAYESIRDGEPEAFSYFFDGPYYLYYRRTDSPHPTVYIEANCDRDENAVYSVVTGELTLEELRDALLAAARILHEEVVVDRSAQITADLVTRLES